MKNLTNNESEKKQFKNHYNYVDDPEAHEINHDISLTLPEQTLSLKTLLERHTRGADVIRYNGVYNNLSHDDLDLEKYNRYDPADRKKIAIAYKQKVAELQQEYDAKTEARAKELEVETKKTDVIETQ